MTEVRRIRDAVSRPRPSMHFNLAGPPATDR
jgi:hypothetical protein